jgi:hypothetical protein
VEQLGPTAENHLLDLSAAGDDSTMKTEPPKSDPPKRKRRWLQFRLRTLMIVVTLLAVPFAYVGQQAKIVRARLAVLKELKTVVNGQRTGFIEHIADDPRHSIPWIRKILGDEPMNCIFLPLSTAKEYRQRIRETFPEADVEAFQPTASNFIKPLPWPDESPGAD